MELVIGREGVETFVETLIETLTCPHEIDGRVVHVGPAIGISMYPRDTRYAEQLLKLADAAMYYAKSSSAASCFAQDLPEDFDQFGVDHDYADHADYPDCFDHPEYDDGEA